MTTSVYSTVTDTFFSKKDISLLPLPYIIASYNTFFDNKSKDMLPNYALFTVGLLMDLPFRAVLTNLKVVLAYVHYYESYGTQFLFIL